jgi:hypothetical protein
MPGTRGFEQADRAEIRDLGSDSESPRQGNSAEDSREQSHAGRHMGDDSPAAAEATRYRVRMRELIPRIGIAGSPICPGEKVGISR